MEFRWCCGLFPWWWWWFQNRPWVFDQRLAELEPKTLDRARDLLVDILPAAPELERLGIWPWAPWRDCSPDLVFTVTQSCGNGPVVVVNEGVDQALDTRSAESFR